MLALPRKLPAAIAAIAAAVIVTAGCSSNPSGIFGGPGGSGDVGGFAALSSSSTPITIGGTLGLTGSLSETSAEYESVYEYWARQVNAHGGLLGHKVVLDILNDNSTASTAQTDYQTLLTQDNVNLLLAPYATYVGVPVVPLARSAGKLLFNGGFVGEQYFDQGDGWMIATYTYQEPYYTEGLFKAIRAMPASQRPTKVAILTNDDPFTLVDRDGYNGQGGAIRYAEQDGMKVVYSQTYASTQTDFTSAVTRAKASGADMLLVLGLPDDEDDIVKEAHVLGYTPKITCVCGSQATTLPNWTSLGSATDDVVGTTVAWPSQHFPGMAQVDAFSKSRGEATVPTYDYVAYAALQVLQQAVEGTKSLNQQTLRNYIQTHTFHTAVGNIRYNSDGITNFSEVITETVNGAQRPVWPAGVATAKLQEP
jgi:branched-chain amino acid transport system substrate-binding protein